MNKKFFVIIVAAMIFVRLVSSVFAEDNSIWASPSCVVMQRLPNGYTEMYNGKIQLDEGTIADGDYYAIAYWVAPYAGLFGRTTADKSIITVEIQRWEERTNLDIEFGDVKKGSTWAYIFDKIAYHKRGQMFAYIKIKIEDNCITKIYTDDDDWQQYGKRIGWW